MTIRDDGVDDAGLRTLLRRAVPDGPDPAGRASEVVRRAHRANRRRGAASVAAVGVMALAVVTGPRLLDPVGGTPEVRSTATHENDTSALAAQLADPVVCPPADTAVSWPSIPTDRVIPNGAVLVRICPADAGSGTAWTPPIEALTSNVAMIIASFNRLPRAVPADFACGILLGQSSAYTLTFQYVDGRVVVLDGNTGTCNAVHINGARGLGRVGATTVLTAYIAALEQQRVDLGAPSISGWPVRCPNHQAPAANGLLPGAQRLELVEAVVCTYAESGEPRSHRLTASQVRVVNADYPQHLFLLPGICDGSPEVPAVIVGVTAWGDDVSLEHQGCDAWYREEHIWTPGSAAQRAIDAALAR